MRVRDKHIKYADYRISEGKLFKYVTPRHPLLASTRDFWREVVPKKRRLEILNECHNELYCRSFRGV